MNNITRKILISLNLYNTCLRFKNWLLNADKKYIAFYSQFINEGDKCFDIGANIGQRTNIFLKLKSSVVSVEPQPACVKELKKRFGKNPNVTIVEKAIGSSEGKVEMHIANAHELSTVSNDWFDRVKSSGRFAENMWNKTITVPLTTLDRLVESYGSPKFAKIDVEGYEYEVVKGLNKPIEFISLEITPEFIESTIQCIERLRKFGNVEINWCWADTPTKFALPKWVNPDEAISYLRKLDATGVAGDIYIKTAVVG